MSKTKIEWADVVWNPVTGCTPISEGCQNCYANRMANRLRGRCGYPYNEPFRVTLHPKRLNEPLKWKKPRRIFVCSMGDLFHEGVPYEYIAKVFEVMNNAEWHTFLVLTKRPERMKNFLERLGWYTHDTLPYGEREYPAEAVLDDGGKYTLPNVWLGVTAENQQRADERIPILLQIPAVVRFVSIEPMLSLVNLTQIRTDVKNITLNALTGIPYDWDYGEWQVEDRIDSKIDWVICGGETGPGARPMNPDWVRNLRDQCKDDVPFFFKQWGEYQIGRRMYEIETPSILKEAKDGIIETVMVEPLSCRGMERYIAVSKETAFELIKVGKKKAGRVLDGRTWDEIPER